MWIRASKKSSTRSAGPDRSFRRRIIRSQRFSRSHHPWCCSPMLPLASLKRASIPPIWGRWRRW